MPHIFSNPGQISWEQCELITRGSGEGGIVSRVRSDRVVGVIACSQQPFVKISVERIITLLAIQRDTVAQANRMTFWSWYPHSARNDGALVSAPRRALGFFLSIILLAGWYLWMNKVQPKATEAVWRLARLHPFCSLGIVLAFVLMSWSGSALTYLAYSVHHAQGVHFRWVLFLGIGEGELRRRYEETFGKDRFFRAPELLGVIALLVFASSALTVVFTSR